MDLTRIDMSGPESGHEAVLRVADAASGLLGFIAVHSTRLGPAVGGLRMRPYGSEAEALGDALRLSHGMTLKNAAADLGLGGGKAVIVGDPARDKTPERLIAMGRAIESLGGRYWTAEDMGMGPADMALIRQATQYVAGLPDGPFASGDPSPVTARGVFEAIRIALRHRFGDAGLAGRRIAVQGLGHVGGHLCEQLAAAGARVVVADRRRGAGGGNRGPLRRRAGRGGGDPRGGGGPARALRRRRRPVGGDDPAAAHGRGRRRGEQPAGDTGGCRAAAGPRDPLCAGLSVQCRRHRERCGRGAPDPDRASFVAAKLAAIAATLDQVLGRAAAAGTSPETVAQALVMERLAAPRR